jgi:hypothetical protein
MLVILPVCTYAMLHKKGIGEKKKREYEIENNRKSPNKGRKRSGK